MSGESQNQEGRWVVGLQQARTLVTAFTINPEVKTQRKLRGSLLSAPWPSGPAADNVAT